MTRKQREQRTGTAALPDLWHFGPGGTLGENQGRSLYDRADSCEKCGKPSQGLPVCDECSDTNGRNES